MDQYSRLPPAEAVSRAGQGDRCRLHHEDGWQWDWGTPLPQRLWQVTKACAVAFEAHEPAQYRFGTLQPGDRLRYETTYWFGQGCDNDPNICERFVVLTGNLAGHCVSTRGWLDVDRSMIEPVRRKATK